MLERAAAPKPVPKHFHFSRLHFHSPSFRAYILPDVSGIMTEIPKEVLDAYRKACKELTGEEYRAIARYFKALYETEA